jgi:hypothetical protein
MAPCAGHGLIPLGESASRTSPVHQPSDQVGGPGLSCVNTVLPSACHIRASALPRRAGPSQQDAIDNRSVQITVRRAREEDRPIITAMVRRADRRLSGMTEQSRSAQVEHDLADRWLTS